MFKFNSLGAKEHLGEDTVIVVTSDNGGASWFGGLNEPLRGGKEFPFTVGLACANDQTLFLGLL